jgi:hypothetical protein
MLEHVWAGDTSARGWRCNNIKLWKSMVGDYTEYIFVVCTHLQWAGLVLNQQHDVRLEKRQEMNEN